ncbi:MAG: phosphohistidine phosphatase SixA [Paraperlucidibaca sp.]
MRLYLLRHADAAFEAERDELRPLTARGWAQAQDVADWLCGQVTGPVRVVASPLLRAQQTASVVSQALGLALASQMPELSSDGDPLRAETALSLLAGEGIEDLIVVSHMPLIASLYAWIAEGTLTTGEAYDLAEVRVLALDIIAPGLGQVDGGYRPEIAEATGDLRSFMTRFTGDK